MIGDNLCVKLLSSKSHQILHAEETPNTETFSARKGGGTEHWGGTEEIEQDLVTEGWNAIHTTSMKDKDTS